MAMAGLVPKVALLGNFLSVAHLFPLFVAHLAVRHRNLATRIWFLWRMRPCAIGIYISVAHQGYMRHIAGCATEKVRAPPKSYIHAPQKYINSTKNIKNVIQIAD